MKKKITQKLTAIIGVIAMAVSMVGTTAFAAEPETTATTTESETTSQVEMDEKVMVDSGVISLASVGSYWPGDHDLGGFTFQDKNQGSSRTYYANQMQIKPAWKPADNPSSEIDLYIKVVRAWNGDVAYEHRFTLNDDVDGKDGSGWWYAESPWFNINNGSDYYIYYEAFTTPGYSGTGTTRKADVHTWIELRN